MKFSDYKYQRPDLEQVKKDLESQLELIGTNQSLEVEKQAIHKMFEINDQIGSLAVLVSIRNSLNTKDEFYEKEQEFFDENGPFLQEYEHNFNLKILKSNHKKELEKELGELIFKRAELAKKTFKPEIIPDMQKENKLSTAITRLFIAGSLGHCRSDFDL